MDWVEEVGDGEDHRPAAVDILVQINLADLRVAREIRDCLADVHRQQLGTRARSLDGALLQQRSGFLCLTQEGPRVQCFSAFFFFLGSNGRFDALLPSLYFSRH